MAERLLLDTDVIVDYLRGREEAVAYFDGIADQELILSAMTVAELYGGVREGNEREQLRRFLGGFRIVPVDRNLAIEGGLLRRDFHPSHGVGLADAIIAATARTEQATLVTLNKKHFPMLDEVAAPY